jgi:hypothetical protein
MISSRMRASRVGLRFILQSRRPWSSLPALGPIQERLGREVNPTIYRPEELAAPRSFVRRVLDGPKIMLVGTEDDIAKLAGKPVAHEARPESRGNRRPARGR